MTMAHISTAPTWPVWSGQEPVHQQDGLCHCANQIVQHLPMWRAMQCGRCGRYIQTPRETSNE